jgi:hypothetical protein
MKNPPLKLLALVTLLTITWYGLAVLNLVPAEITHAFENSETQNQLINCEQERQSHSPDYPICSNSCQNHIQCYSYYLLMSGFEKKESLEESKSPFPPSLDNLKNSNNAPDPPPPKN